MRYHKITSPDINNGLGFRVTLWLSGCSLSCPGCHNPETHDFLGGKEFNEDSLNFLLEKLDKPYIKGLTISGGNPFESNLSELLNIIKSVKNKFPKKDIWVFSGFTLQECLNRNSDAMNEILNSIDYLVDGRFLIKELDLTLPFRGSKNQIIWKRTGDLTFENISENL